MINILIFREIFKIPRFHQSFDNLNIEGFNIKIIDISGINENENIEKLFSEIVREGKIKNPNIVFVPSIIGPPLSYYGIVMAMHWRLDPVHQEINNIPIIIFGVEEVSAFYKNCEYSSFLKTPNVEYINYSEEAIKTFLTNYKLNEENDNDITLDLSYYNVQPPTSYKTHHAIVNEWSILRWAKAIGIKSAEINNIEELIGNQLYYKLLNVRFPISILTKPFSIDFVGRGSILYIDDEVRKGWDSIFRHIIKHNYFSFGEDFKAWSKEEIILKSIEKVQSIDPLVVILDLRLHDDDFDVENNPKELSGYKVLKAIKNINKGIQVIIFSATNKIWNLLELQNEEADGFIMKEPPELSIDPDYSRLAIENLVSAISMGFKMSFLKEIYLKTKEIENLTSNPSFEKEVEFKTRVKNNLDISFRLLMDIRKSSKYFNYAFLQLFQIIEDFISLPIVFLEGSDCFVKLDEKEICVQRELKDRIEWPIKLTSNGKYELFKLEYKKKDSRYRRLDTNFKVSSILIFRYGNINSSVNKWTDIYKTRNTKAAHFSKDNELYTEEIFTLLDFIRYFIDPLNQSEINILKGLPIKTYDETIELLKTDGRYKVVSKRK